MLLGREKNSPAWEVVGMRESPPDTCLGGRRSLLPGRGSFAPDACLGRGSHWLQSPGRVREARISLSCLYHGAKARQAGDLLILIFTGKALCLSGGRQPADSREPEVKTNLLMRMNFARSAKAAPGSCREVFPMPRQGNTRPFQPNSNFRSRPPHT